MSERLISKYGKRTSGCSKETTSESVPESVGGYVAELKVNLTTR